ncbi:unnamed protein product [Schistosoma mattheei]|uniref:DUF5725 domain-containing protein n=1 Tax=Schistosoma mattheei TaxID=31246 RepID=A0AA85BU15_9TREM|nr:unnamed protein product [Schistosoma mattheei]
MFLSSSEYNSNDLLNSNRKSSTLSSSTSPTTMPTSSSSSSSPSSSIRFRGNKFGRLKTKCLNLNRYQQNYSLSNNRLHLCNKPNHFNSIMTTSALKAIRRSTINLPNTHWSNLSLGSQITTTTPSSSSSSPAFTSIIDQKLKSNFLTDLQFPENQYKTILMDYLVVLNPDEPREIFIGGVQSVALPLWAYCKCLTMVRGEPHELGPRLCLRLLQSLFSYII